MPDADVEPLDGGDAWAPNQVALELLRASQDGEVEVAIVVARHPNGALWIDWSTPASIADLLELARYLSIEVDRELLEAQEDPE